MESASLAASWRTDQRLFFARNNDA